ncbi:hypothetical protein [Chengkuizengella sediminis]|uniref:hypothetical protein n=1 Tax=Chengkuizengella sediminis TaxID=1885917 RepID=UPI001F0DAF98|nr:hypothetical protein [Chengkuizengella sediminis]
MNDNLNMVQPSVSLPEPSSNNTAAQQQNENTTPKKYPSSMTQPLTYSSPCSGCKPNPCNTCADQSMMMPMYSMGVQDMTPYMYPMGTQQMNSNVQSMYSMGAQGMNTNMHPMYPTGVQGMNANMDSMYPMGTQAMNTNIYPMGNQELTPSTTSPTDTQGINPSTEFFTAEQVEEMTEGNQQLHPKEVKEMSANMYPMHPQEMQQYPNAIGVAPMFAFPSMQPPGYNYYQQPNMYPPNVAAPTENMMSHYMLPKMDPEKVAEQAANLPYYMRSTSSPTDLTNVFMQISPWIRHGLDKAENKNYKQAMEEVALISYLMGSGFDARTSHQIVESWEVREMFSDKDRDEEMNSENESSSD